MVYPIAAQPNGKQQINWVLEVPSAINAEKPTADYDAVVPAEKVLELVGGLSAPFLDIKAHRTFTLYFFKTCNNLSPLTCNS